jgi:hypothetical protein
MLDTDGTAEMVRIVNPLPAGKPALPTEMK